MRGGPTGGTSAGDRAGPETPAARSSEKPAQAKAQWEDVAWNPPGRLGHGSASGPACGGVGRLGCPGPQGAVPRGSGAIEGEASAGCAGQISARKFPLSTCTFGEMKFSFHVLRLDCDLQSMLTQSVFP